MAKYGECCTRALVGLRGNAGGVSETAVRDLGGVGGQTGSMSGCKQTGCGATETDLLDGPGRVGESSIARMVNCKSGSHCWPELGLVFKTMNSPACKSDNLHNSSRELNYYADPIANSPRLLHRRKVDLNNLRPG